MYKKNLGVILVMVNHDSKYRRDPLKLGYIEFAMAGNYSTRGIQRLLTRRVSYI